MKDGVTLKKNYATLKLQYWVRDVNESSRVYSRWKLEAWLKWGSFFLGSTRPKLSTRTFPSAAGQAQLWFWFWYIFFFFLRQQIVAFKIYLFIFKYESMNSSRQVTWTDSSFARHPKMGLDSSIKLDRLGFFQAELWAVRANEPIAFSILRGYNSNFT